MSNTPPCSNLQPGDVQRRNTGTPGTGAVYWAFPLDFIPLPESGDDTKQDDSPVDFLVVAAKKDEPGNAAAPFEYAKSSKIKDPIKLLELNKKGTFVVDSNPGEQGFDFHGFKLDGKNRGKIVPGKSFNLQGPLILRFWLKKEDLENGTKYDNSGPRGPKLFKGKMGDDAVELCSRPFEFRIITVQQKNEASFANQTAVKLLTMDTTPYEPLQLLGFLRAKMPKSKDEAVQSALQLLETDRPYAKQIPHKTKDRAGNPISSASPEMIPKVAFLVEEFRGSPPLHFRYTEDSGNVVCVTFCHGAEQREIQLLVPMHIFKKNANASTIEDAVNIYTIAASLPGALVALVCWDEWLKRQDRWCAEFAPNTFEHCGCLILDPASLLKPIYDACIRTPLPEVRGVGLKRKLCNIAMGGVSVMVNGTDMPLLADITVHFRKINNAGTATVDPTQFLHNTCVASHSTIPYESAAVVVWHTKEGGVLHNSDFCSSRDYHSAGMMLSAVAAGRHQQSFARRVQSAIDDDDDDKQTPAEVAHDAVA